LGKRYRIGRREGYLTVSQAHVNNLNSFGGNVSI